MHVTRFAEAPEYQAPNHFDMRCVYLQGRAAGPSVQLWMGVSTIEPGGHTGLDPSPMEKHYVVLEGELTLVGEMDGQTESALLGLHDSARFAPGEKRQLRNHTDRPAKVLLAMPLAPPAAG
ncbi:MAG: cupin domain-containing protein [Betaproteobacteria bacterium]